MALKRIIIDYDDTMDTSDVILRVYRVATKGYVSISRSQPKYAHATVYDSGAVVACRDRRTATAADSFLVYKEGHFPGWNRKGE